MMLAGPVSSDLFAFANAHPAADLSRNRHLAPKSAGVYVWWFDIAPGDAPFAGAPEHDGWRLLYVGIAPRRSKSGKTSRSTLYSRLRTHCRGPIGSSTLRRSLAALLQDELNLEVKTPAGPKPKLCGDGEAHLSRWLNDHARVGWIEYAEPWRVEHALLDDPTLCLSLNVQGAKHGFVDELSRLRLAFCRPA